MAISEMKKHIYFFDNIPNIVVDLFLNEKLKLNRKVRNRIKKIKSKKNYSSILTMENVQLQLYYTKKKSHHSNIFSL